MARDAERERWLDEIVTLAEGAGLRKVSIDTLRRARAVPRAWFGPSIAGGVAADMAL